MKIELTIPAEVVTAITREIATQLEPLISRLVQDCEDPFKERLLGVVELCTFLGVSQDWIYQRTAKNEIPFIRIGRLVKFRHSEIVKWLSAKVVPVVAPLSRPLPVNRLATRKKQPNNVQSLEQCQKKCS